MFLKNFLSLPYDNRHDHRNIFITTYAITFVIQILSETLLRFYLKVSMLRISIFFFVVIIAIDRTSRYLAFIFFGKFIELNRRYRLNLKNDSSSWFGFVISFSIVFICMLFCSILLVIACMFSEDKRYELIWHNFVFVHLIIFFQRWIIIVLLFYKNRLIKSNFF